MEEELVTLSQVIQDAKEPDKIFTDYSRQFNLAASKKEITRYLNIGIIQIF